MENKKINSVGILAVIGLAAALVLGGCAKRYELPTNGRVTLSNAYGRSRNYSGLEINSDSSGCTISGVVDGTELSIMQKTCGLEDDVVGYSITFPGKGPVNYDTKNGICGPQCESVKKSLKGMLDAQEGTFMKTLEKFH